MDLVSGNRYRVQTESLSFVGVYWLTDIVDGQPRHTFFEDDDSIFLTIDEDAILEATEDST